MKKDKADSAQQSVLELITASYPREAHDEEELDSAPRIINKQKLRDHQATRILTAYVDDYKYSSKRNRTYRSTLFWGGSILTALIVLVCLFLLVLWIPAIIQQDSEAASGTQ
ncbi:MAG: hypothetical protein IH607_02925, partial [Firmicutes bacterium]|nr:hypothetical protein [Bacillota bacterium]